MLSLVSADNLLQLFFGWEGVGLSSFLLIGFWFNKRSARYAALKAFLVNRIADIGLIIALILVAINFGNIDYKTLLDEAKRRKLYE